MSASMKRLLSLLLCLTMVLAVLPVVVFAEAETMVYLKPNANWLRSNARFAAYFYGNGELWLDCTDADGDGVYEVAVPEGYDSVIFCRMNPNTTENVWINKWNQTADLTLPTNGNNCYVLTDGSWDAGGWTTYSVDGGVGETGPAAVTYYVSGDFNMWTAAGSGYLMADNGDGTYALTLTLTTGVYGLKITDGTWNNSWGVNGNDFKINVITEGAVTISFDPTTGAITASGDCLGETESELVIHSVQLVGDIGLTGFEWDLTQNQMECTGGVYSITFTGVKTGTYEFKFAANGSWDINWSTGAEVISGESCTAWLNPQNNSCLNVLKNNSTVTFTLDTTSMNLLTGEGAVCMVVVQVPELILGDNVLTLDAGDVDGDSWTYTVTQAGTLTFNVTSLAADDGTGVITEVAAENISAVMSTEYATQINGISVYGFPAEFTADMGDVVTIQICNIAGAAAELTLTLTMGTDQEETPAVPGSKENPIVIETLPYEVTVEDVHDIYYIYTAAEDITLVITKPEGNDVYGLTNYSQPDENSYYIAVTAGETISINPWGNNAGTYTICVGEAAVYEKVSVYFDASLYGWTNINAYAWNETGTVTAEWPGEAMVRQEDGIWTIQIPTNATSIIFNNGEDYQTWPQTFAADTVYDGFASGSYGSTIGTSFYVTGDGAFGDWVCDNAAGIMTNNGDGTFTAEIPNVVAGTYGIKITNGTWDAAWGDTSTASGNFELSLSTRSDITVTFNLNTQLISITQTALPVEVPTITLKYPSLSFEDVIVMNVYYAASDLEDVAEMGLITYSEKVSVYDVETAEHVIPGYAWSEADGYYYSTTTGIAAKELGDTIYFAVYAKLTDGTYTYTKLVGYSPKTYAYNQLKTGIEEMRPLVVAMLNYGAAAQTYFSHNTDALVNADLTADQQALVEDYSDTMIAAVTLPDSTKLGTMVNNGGYSRRYPTISFEGAFCINYYFLPSAAPAGDITMYVWNQEAFDGAQTLSVDNATQAITMTLTETGEYLAAVEGIAAKELDNGVYVSFCYSDGTTDYCSGVIGYSIGQYCKAQAAQTGTMADLAAACAVYGYYAKQLFIK